MVESSLGWAELETNSEIRDSWYIQMQGPTKEFDFLLKSKTKINVSISHREER